MKEILLPIRIESLPEGGFLATSDELPRLAAKGRTIAETLEIAQDVARKLAESYRDHDDPLAPCAQPRSSHRSGYLHSGFRVLTGRLSGLSADEVIRKLRPRVLRPALTSILPYTYNTRVWEVANAKETDADD
jgi:predicted RNase H-like HicB family nuclease